MCLEVFSMYNAMLILVFHLFLVSPSDESEPLIFAGKGGGQSLQLSHNESTLVFNARNAEYINAQARADASKMVIIVADSILFVENVTFNDVDIVFICNHFSTRGKVLRLAPTDSVKRSDGHAMWIVARTIGESSIELPGIKGMDGKRGARGDDGDSLQVVRKDAVSGGTRGSNGKPGRNGGNGGILEIFSMQEKYSLSFEAPPGKKGRGGGPGRGGKTFTSRPLGIGGRFSITVCREKGGVRGSDGKDGRKGVKKENLLQKKEFEKKVIEYIGGDLTLVKDSGWQIHFDAKPPVN